MYLHPGQTITERYIQKTGKDGGHTRKKKHTPNISAKHDKNIRTPHTKERILKTTKQPQSHR